MSYLIHHDQFWGLNFLLGWWMNVSGLIALSVCLIVLMMNWDSWLWNRKPYMWKCQLRCWVWCSDDTIHHTISNVAYNSVITRRKIYLWWCTDWSNSSWEDIRRFCDSRAWVDDGGINCKTFSFNAKNSLPWGILQIITVEFGCHWTEFVSNAFSWCRRVWIWTSLTLDDVDDERRLDKKGEWY